MDYGSRRWGLPLRLRSGPHLGFALALLCATTTACGSGGSGRLPLGTQTSSPLTFGVGGSSEINAGASVRDSVIAAPLSSVWFVLPSVFEKLEVEAPTVDAASLVIGNPGYRVGRIGGVRPSNYLDCGGGGPNADRFEVTLQLMVQLADRADGATLLRTVVDAYARPRDVSGNSFHCTSKGALEGRIVDLITEELVALVATQARVSPEDEAPRADEPPGTDDLLFADNLRLARDAFAPTGRVRLPVSGDLLRVECLSPQDPGGRIDEARFVRMARGELVVRVRQESRDVAVPVANLGSIEVFDRRSRTFWAGITGGVLGAVAGGFLGASVYDRDAKLHFGQGTYIAGGAILAGVVGVLLGRSVGSAFSSEAWADPPRDWAVQYLQPVSVSPATSTPARVCPSFDADGP